MAVQSVSAQFPVFIELKASHYTHGVWLLVDHDSCSMMGVWFHYWQAVWFNKLPTFLCLWQTPKLARSVGPEFPDLQPSHLDLKMYTIPCWYEPNCVFLHVRCSRCSKNVRVLEDAIVVFVEEESFYKFKFLPLSQVGISFAPFSFSLSLIKKRLHSASPFYVLIFCLFWKKIGSIHLHHISNQ